MNGTLRELNIFPDQFEQTNTPLSIDKHTARLISETLRTNHTIQIFHFWFQRISVTASQVFFQFLKENNTLTTLHMQETEICGGLRWLCDSLRTNDGLNLLWIGDKFNVDDEEITFLTECLCSVSKLKELTFEANLLTDHCAPLFAKLIRTNRSLRKIYFNGIANRSATKGAWFPVIDALKENYFLLSFVSPLDYSSSYAHYSITAVQHVLRRNSGFIRKLHDLLRLARLFYLSPTTNSNIKTSTNKNTTMNNNETNVNTNARKNLLFDVILGICLESGGLSAKQISQFYRFSMERSTLGLTDSFINVVFYNENIF
jgi:hypothetical protein